MVAAIRDDNPTFVIGNKLLLGSVGPVPEELYEIPLSATNVVRPGQHATVVATGRMVQEAMAAAEELSAEGVEVELIDPRTLQPFDRRPSSSRFGGPTGLWWSTNRCASVGWEPRSPLRPRSAGIAFAPVATRVGAGGTDTRILASPNARRIATLMSVDLATIGGSGPGRRIVSADVQAAAAVTGPTAPAVAATATVGRTKRGRGALATSFSAAVHQDLDWMPSRSRIGYCIRSID